MDWSKYVTQVTFSLGFILKNCGTSTTFPLITVDGLDLQIEIIAF
jgi:hypothetical protein